MAEATPDGYKQLGRAKLLAPPEPWAPMAFSNGMLIARDMHKMVCLDLTGGAVGATTTAESLPECHGGLAPPCGRAMQAADRARRASPPWHSLKRPRHGWDRLTPRR